ncbi:hypothetical protein MsAc7_10190 [Methanolapillus millepedarum]|uniref:Helicase HerA central domain-containing protein n=2 Tax=Methanolapillus millepedarum TaxID=3028296 RepID=A0AA96V2U9_9EURY|nr:hypothetical protein MsAc7_10190 [Methanosarcinaceae archaeon Ac7]
MTMADAIEKTPISLLTAFLEKQEKYEKTQQLSKWRFVGYVLELGFDSAKIITSDPYKIAVGGIPRGSFIIMVPESFEGLIPHFTLLRVTGVATTPLSSQVQQTYFELHKKSMPEIDIWTQSELQWGALDCDVLGMFYPDPENFNKLSFSGDVNNVVSAHKYKVYSPDAQLLDLVVNSLVKEENKVEIGNLRTMECKLSSSENPIYQVPVQISMKDFMGCRTAMFGKTRLGKSNVVKLIMQGMLDATVTDKNVGQLVFDVNGEYANDGEQLDITDTDVEKNSLSICSANKERCEIYALTKRSTTESKELRLNFYENPEICLGVLASMLEQSGNNSGYVKGFYSSELPSIEDVVSEKKENLKIRSIRKIQMYWAILKKAGFPSNESNLKKLNLRAKSTFDFNPGFSEELRAAIEVDINQIPNTLDALVNELEKIAKFVHENESSSLLLSSSGNALFDSDDKAFLKFLRPSSSNSSGPSILRSYIKYHSPNAGDFINEILKSLDQGKTVILDLGNANKEIREYFSKILSSAVFSHQEIKFVNNKLGNHFIELYFEEAHNLFPKDDDLTGVYARFAKEGAKFHIGMVYSTQSPSTINKELLVQTENFFVGHLSSKYETKALSDLQISFAGVEEDILRSKTPGYMRMLTLSHRFVIPVQAYLYDPKIGEEI